MGTPEQRRAVVTGAASGIGRAVAEQLSRAGLDVIGIDRDPIDAPAARQVDLGDRDALGALCESLAAEQPCIDVLVNVAGVFQPSSAATFDPDVFWRTLEVNLYAPTALAAALGRGMCARGWGRVVTVTSVHALVSAPDSLAYGASKTGLTGVTRALAIEWAPHGVLVNAVAPGFVDTAMSVVDGENELESSWFKDLYVEGGRLPLGRAAQPREIAAAIGWLVSPENTYVTGATIVADGGLTVTL
jgi:NAD(P)-dependent dehydrogenase (short-subunit alcohol dehydrogenase family)